MRISDWSSDVCSSDLTHRVLDHSSLLMRGLDDELRIPVSRHTENRREDLAGHDDLEVLIESEEAGLCLVHDRRLRQVHMFNHLEYDSATLDAEYRRDLDRRSDEHTSEITSIMRQSYA